MSLYTSFFSSTTLFLEGSQQNFSSQNFLVNLKQVKTTNMILQSLQILLRFACESSQPGKTKSYPAYGANNFLRSTSSHFHENDDGVHKLSRWDHSTTTWTEFCHSPPPTLPCVENFYTLIVGQSRHFLTPSPRHLVHVVIEWPLGDG